MISTSSDIILLQNMISVSKVRFTRKLACKWEKGLGTRPNMSCKVSSGYLLCNDRSEAQTEVGRGPHEIRMFGRIVGAQSAEQSVILLLTPKPILKALQTPDKIA